MLVYMYIVIIITRPKCVVCTSSAVFGMKVTNLMVNFFVEEKME